MQFVDMQSVISAMFTCSKLYCGKKWMALKDLAILTN